jgi:intracellular septation protein A
VSEAPREDAAGRPADDPDVPSAAGDPGAEDLGASGLEGGSGRPGDATTEQLMAQAIGGWRGLIDGSLPSVVFLVAYVVTGSSLQPAIIAAVVAGLLIAVLRIVRRQPLQQALSGFLGVAFCAWFASRTGNAEDYYLPGLLINAVYGTVLAVSCLVGHPLLGYGVGAATGDMTGWRQVPEQRRAYALATWFFVAVFALRIAVQLPLYLAGAVAALGTARLFMGWPLFALAAFLAYRVISTARRDAPVPVREV